MNQENRKDDFNLTASEINHSGYDTNGESQNFRTPQYLDGQYNGYTNSENNLYSQQVLNQEYTYYFCGYDAYGNILYLDIYGNYLTLDSNGQLIYYPYMGNGMAESVAYQSETNDTIENVASEGLNTSNSGTVNEIGTSSNLEKTNTVSEELQKQSINTSDKTVDNTKLQFHTSEPVNQTYTDYVQNTDEPVNTYMFGYDSNLTSESGNCETPVSYDEFKQSHGINQSILNEEEANTLYEKAERSASETGKTARKMTKTPRKNLIRVGILALAIAICGGGYGVYDAVRDKSEIKVCQSTTSYNKGIGFTFYIGEDGKTITAIEKNDKVSLDFIKKNVTEENAKAILEEYKKSVKTTYSENLKNYKDKSFFSGNLTVKKNYISTTYRFEVGSKKFNYKKNEKMMNDFGLNYYYNEDLGKFIYNEDQFLSTSTPLGGIENVQCVTNNDIKIIKTERAK